MGQKYLSNRSILLSCKQNLSLNQLNHFFQTMCKLLRYVLSNSLLEFGAFQPRYPDVNGTFACIMSKGRFLNLIPKVDLDSRIQQIKFMFGRNEKNLKQWRVILDIRGGKNNFTYPEVVIKWNIVQGHDFIHNPTFTTG